MFQCYSWCFRGLSTRVSRGQGVLLHGSHIAMSVCQVWVLLSLSYVCVLLSLNCVCAALTYLCVCVALLSYVCVTLSLYHSFTLTLSCLFMSLYVLLCITRVTVKKKRGVTGRMNALAHTHSWRKKCMYVVK